MAPRATAQSSDTINLTAREQELWGYALQCFETEPKIDVAKFADLAHLAPGSAANAWRNLRAKMGFLTDNNKSPTKKRAAEDAATTKTTPKKPRTGKGKRAANKAQEDGDDAVADLMALKSEGAEDGDGDDEADFGALELSAGTVKSEPTF